MATNNTSAIYLVTQERPSINWTFRGRLSEEKEFAEKTNKNLMTIIYMYFHTFWRVNVAWGTSLEARDA